MGKEAIPMLQVRGNGGVRSAANSGNIVKVVTRLRSRSAALSAPSIEVSGRIKANSSPPYRAAKSLDRPVLSPGPADCPIASRFREGLDRRRYGRSDR